MKRINVGQVNDLTQMAVISGYTPDNEPMVDPLSKEDLQFQPADLEIGYDSGVYPGIALEELPRYICRKAASQL